MTVLSYELEGRRLIEIIDPVPVTATGNYLVFRLYGGEESEEWCTFLETHGLKNAQPMEDLVPLPSGGVFAEAVLGRSNSAERLDITRFWDWQASPIPIGPPEINPLTAGGKGNDATPSTAPLEAPVVNIVNPPSLPDPAGLGPALSALATRDLFRDMSGLAATTALAQAVMGAAQSGAANAAAAATASEQTAAHLFRDIAEIAAKAAAGMKGIPLIGGTSGGVSALPATPNNLGLAIAGGRDLDRREAEAAERQSSATGVAPAAPVPRPQGAPASSRARRKTVHEAAVFHGRPPLQEPERARTTEVSLVSTLERNEKRTREAVDVDVDLIFSRAWQPNASELPEEQLLMHVQQGSARSIAGKLQPGVSYTVRAPHLKIRPDAIQTQLQRTFVGLFGRIPQVREQLAELAKLTASALSPEVPVNVTATDVVVPLGKEPLLLDLVFRIESDPSAALELKVNANVDLADLAAGLAGVIGRAQAALAASVRKVTNVAKLGHLNWDVLGFDANAGGTLRYVPELVTHAYLEPRPR